MHMCTHVPNDPEFVIAIEITSKSYPLYQALAKSKATMFDANHGFYLVIPTNDAGWGVMSSTELFANYSHVPNTVPNLYAAI